MFLTIKFTNSYLFSSKDQYHFYLKVLVSIYFLYIQLMFLGQLLGSNKNSCIEFLLQLKIIIINCPADNCHHYLNNLLKHKKVPVAEFKVN